MCVFAFWGTSQIPLVSFFFVTAHRAGASVSGRDFGRRGAAPAPQFQLCERRVGPCCACSGCRAAAFVARVALLACIGGLAFVVCVCLWYLPALVRACLRIPNHSISLQHMGIAGVAVTSEQFPAEQQRVTKRRDGEACIGNQKLEQETTEGTHA